jgi:hypothetical protein
MKINTALKIVSGSTDIVSSFFERRNSEITNQASHLHFLLIFLQTDPRDCYEEVY